MKTKITFFSALTLLGLIISCTKVSEKTPNPDPIQQSDPENRPPGSLALLAPDLDAEEESRTPTFIWE